MPKKYNIYVKTRFLKRDFFLPNTDKKENKIFLIYKEIQRDRVQSHILLMASSYMVKDLRIPRILGGPSSYMTLHPIPSEFPYTVYEKNFVFFFISDLSGKSGQELAPTRDLAAGSEECGRVSAQREVGAMAAGGSRRQQAQAFSVQI
jgi:hypothetical protein